MVNNKQIYILLILFIKNVSSYTQSCQEMIGDCNLPQNCVNNICISCDDPTLDISNLCQCEKGSFYNDNKCEPCHEGCSSCFGAKENECLSCDYSEGIYYNYQTKTCECESNYLPTNNINQPCEQCYEYGNQCLKVCPEETFANKKYMICENLAVRNIMNTDDDYYIVIAIILISVITVLAILLYIFFYEVFKSIFSNKKKQIYQLTIEEIEYFNEILDKEEKQEKQLKENEEETRKKIIIEKEEEQKQRDIEEEEKKKVFLTEKERIKKDQEFRKKKIMDEEERKKKEADKLKDLEKQAEEMKKQEDEQKKQEELDKLEKEKKKKEDEELKQKQLIEEKEKQEKVERKKKRAQTKQATMKLNQYKIQKARSQRFELQKKKTTVEIENQNFIKKEEQVKQDLWLLKQKYEDRKLQKQKTLKQKEIVLSLQQEAETQKEEITKEFGGVNLTKIQQKIQDLNQDDIIFLQNLRTPPQRIKMTLEAIVIVMTCNTKQTNWDEIKKFIQNMNFRRNLIYYTMDFLPDHVYKKIVKDYQKNDQWVVEKIYKASKAAGVFAEWINALVQQKELKLQNEPLFERLLAIQNKEKELQKQLFKIDQEMQKGDNEDKELDKEIKIIDQKDKEFQEVQEIQKSKKQELDDIEKSIKKLDSQNISIEEFSESSSSDNSFDDSNNSKKSQKLIRDM